MLSRTKSSEQDLRRFLKLRLSKYQDTHSTPGGGANAPIRCLPPTRKIYERSSSSSTQQVRLTFGCVICELNDGEVMRVTLLTHRCSRRGHCPRLVPWTENFISTDQHNFSIFTDFLLLVFFFLFLVTGSTSQITIIWPS